MCVFFITCQRHNGTVTRSSGRGWTWACSRACEMKKRMSSHVSVIPFFTRHCLTAQCAATTTAVIYCWRSAATAAVVVVVVVNRTRPAPAMTAIHCYKVTNERCFTLSHGQLFIDTSSTITLLLAHVPYYCITWTVHMEPFTLYVTPPPRYTQTRFHFWHCNFAFSCSS